MAHSVLAQMLGVYILESRQQLGMIQKKLAKSLGCSEQFLGRIEKGEVMIPEGILITAIETLDLKYEKIKKIYRVSSDARVDHLFSKNAPKRKSGS